MDLERWGLGLDVPIEWPDRISRVTSLARFAKRPGHTLIPRAMVRVEYGPIRRKSRRADVECA